MNKEELENIIKKSISRTEIAKELGYSYYNGRIAKIINSIIEQYSIDISHFIPNGSLPKYKKSLKICPICNKEFIESIGKAKEKTYCSKKCANSNRICSTKTKEKLKKINLGKKYIRQITNYNGECKYCKKPFLTTKKEKKFCDNSCCSKYFWATTEYRDKITSAINEKVKNGTHSGWKTRTKEPSYPEKYFMQVLDNFGVKYIREEPCGKYFIDFAIYDKMIALEIDGSQHLEVLRVESDKKKDEVLKQNGWNVIRIKWYNPINNTNKQKLYSQINTFKQMISEL